MPSGAKPGERRGGRPKGVPNRVTATTRERIERDADPIGFLIRIQMGEPIEAAPLPGGTRAEAIIPTLEQRISAASQLARKVTPDAKDRPIRLTLPLIATAADVLAALDVVAAAMARGEITPLEAQAVASVLETKRQAIATVDHEERLAALETEKEANGNRVH